MPEMQFWEIFSLATGAVYILLEILQNRWMWVVCILTSSAAAWVFFNQGLYASMALNIYYVLMSFQGIWRWARVSGKLKEQESTKSLHLVKPSPRILLISGVLTVAGTLGIMFVLRALSDPMPLLDAFVAVLSAIATWWLTRSFPEQWLVWIVADLANVILCASQHLPWMIVLYAIYLISSVYGYFHWKKEGQYV